jgi:DNA polymerase phi
MILFCEIRKKIGAGLDSTKMHVIRDYLLIQLRLQVLHPDEFWGAEIDVIICCKKTFSSIAQCHSYSFSYCS